MKIFFVAAAFAMGGIAGLVHHSSLRPLREQTTISVTPGDLAAPSAECPAGYLATAGGFLANPPLRVQASLPAQDLSDWEAWVYNPGSYPAVVTVYAICVKG